MIVVLAGGTGGAKLARGLLDVVGEERLTVIANTGDDTEVHGLHVSPDPDLIAYWLAGTIDERGWGIGGDTWEVSDALERAGRAVWFRLGDRDLAMCLIRSEYLAAGTRLTEAHSEVMRAVGVRARVLPMCDETVRTHVLVSDRWRPLQEFLILERGAAPEGVELRGIERARPTEDVLAAIESAEAIVIGPSNPVISIGPILAVPGIAEAIHARGVPVIAVSPFVGGRAVKGPTEAFCTQAGIPLGTDSIVTAYGELIDGIIADEELSGDGPPVRLCNTMMDSDAGRRRVAEETLALATSLRPEAG